MKTKILILLSIFTMLTSCAQTTYSEETLKKQSEKITTIQKQKRVNKVITTVGDIIKNLDVPIISYSYDTETWDSEKVNLIMLKFYTNKEFEYKMDNKINLHKIYIYVKNPLPLENVTLLTRKNQGKWTKEVNDYFKDMEVESVRAE